MTTAITRMQEIANVINESLDDIQSSSIRIGLLLNEANEEMKAQGFKSPDFLKWCKDEFCLGKAQVYRLIKIALFFKEDERFNGVSMRVLYALAVDGSKDTIDKAAELAANGTLNTRTVMQLLEPESVMQKPVEPTKQEQQAENDEQQKAIEEALNNVQERQECEEKVLSTAEAVNLVHSINSCIPPVPSDEFMAEITELRQALNAANELIRSLQAEKVQHNTAKSMPMLPQFKNACPYAVLGLGQLEAKQKSVVNKAFRELVKLGYGKGHEAFELLEKAKEQLLAEVEG